MSISPQPPPITLHSMSDFERFAGCIVMARVVLSSAPSEYCIYRIARKVSRVINTLETAGLDITKFQLRGTSEGEYMITRECIPRMGIEVKLVSREVCTWMRCAVLAGTHVFGNRSTERSLHWIP